MHKEDTKKKLLESAKKEFLAYGYEKASLRKICKEAQVTTGALYFFFKDKNDLFNHLVCNFANKIKKMLKDHTSEEEVRYKKKEFIEHDFDVEFAKSLISYYYANEEAGKLLINCSQGSSYENYINEIISYFEQIYINILTNMY